MPVAGLGDDIGAVQLRLGAARAAGRAASAVRGAPVRPRRPRGTSARGGAGGAEPVLGEAGGRCMRRLQRQRRLDGARRGQRPAAAPGARADAALGPEGAERRRRRRVVDCRQPASASAWRMAPRTRPRTTPGSRKRTSALAGWTFTSTRLRRAVEEQRDRRVAVARQHVGIGGAHRAEQQPVAHRPAVDEDVLRHRRAAREGGQSGMAGEPQPLALGLDGDGVGGEVAPEHAGRRGQAGRPAGRPARPRSGPATRSAAAGRVAQAEGDVGPRQREPADGVGDRLRLGPVGAQEFQPRRRRVEEVAHLDGRAGARAAGRGARRAGRHRRRSPSASAPATREVSVSRATEPIDGSASPRKPKKRMSTRSSPSILEVAWRSSASASSAAVMPQPSSATRISDLPPSAMSISMRRGAGVDGVLDQLLDRRGRALDHLARGDPVGGGLGQAPDARAFLHDVVGEPAHCTTCSRAAADLQATA